MPSIIVKGMTCNHCRMSVAKALEAIPGVSGVDVDLLTGKATFVETAPVDLAVVKRAIEKIGFEVEG
ncbi:MAG: heavy metal-associated domain-containing protein [Humidesulfovibrio sp.]|nr:mercury transporter [Desulfovibrio sp.]MDO9081722.1 heavy metal-associated domain-containing protein [Humidesulfovibrio sp.]